MRDYLMAICVLLVTSLTVAGLHAEDKSFKLTIVKAVYGDLPDGGKIDVTEKLKGKINDDGLKIDVNNENFTDPAPGEVKVLTVEFKLDETKLDMTVVEGEALTIPVKIGKLKIISALYGNLPDGPKTDVTLKVQVRVLDNALSFEACKEIFGDPAKDAPKKLQVEYTFNGGEKKTKTVAENARITINNKGEAPNVP